MPPPGASFGAMLDTSTKFGIHRSRSGNTRPARTPGFVRTIGGVGAAGVYAFGVEFNPFTNEVLVGDYWNYQARRFDLSGKEVGSFYEPPAQRRGQPYAIAVDPRNGDIYITEIAEGKPIGYVSHWDRFGNFLSELFLDVDYHA